MVDSLGNTTYSNAWNDRNRVFQYLCEFISGNYTKLDIKENIDVKCIYI